jgi:hypothetical protein
MTIHSFKIFIHLPSFDITGLSSSNGCTFGETNEHMKKTHNYKADSVKKKLISVCQLGRKLNQVPPYIFPLKHVKSELFIHAILLPTHLIIKSCNSLNSKTETHTQNKR